MRKLRLIFSILTVVFASLGLAKILSYDISLPLMFISMILTFLVWSKECYDKGAKRDSHIFLGVAIFIAAITVFNIISNLSSKEDNTEIPKGNPQFMATVLGFEDNYILVDPFKGDEAINSMDMALVSKDVISKIDVPDVKEGDKISVVYNGSIAKSYPAKLEGVFAIYPVDKNGDTIRLYSQKEINSAIDVIKKEFKRDWKGCTLKEIHYAGDKVSKEHQEFAERYNADEVIVLVSTFDVDESGGDGSLNPNSTYTDWNWILVRKNGGKWKHVDHGY